MLAAAARFRGPNRVRSVASKVISLHSIARRSLHVTKRHRRRYSNGYWETVGAFASLSAQDLGGAAIKGVLDRTGVDPSSVDLVLMGRSSRPVKARSLLARPPSRAASR